MEITVQKYGGTSLASHQQITSVARRIAQAHFAGKAPVVVVSARGTTTDDLVAAASTLSKAPDPVETDKLLATGELASAALLAIALRESGVPAVSLSGPEAGLRATGRHGSGRVTTVDPTPVRDLVRAGNVVIVAGFQALSENGALITLGRGGSDTSAVALAVAHGARHCEIYSDVDGVRRVDPRLVPWAPLLPTVTSAVMAEMAFSGARVMNARSVELAAAHGVDIVVRHSSGSGKGSVIVARGSNMPSAPALEERAGVIAVTHETNTAHVVVHGCDGVMVLNTLTRLQIPVDAMAWSSSGDEPRSEFCVSEQAIDQVVTELEPIVRAHGGTAEIQRAVGKVSIVGSGLLSRPELTAAALAGLAERDIRALCVSSSQARVMMLVPRAQVEEAVLALYQEFEIDFIDDSSVGLATA